MHTKSLRSISSITALYLCYYHIDLPLLASVGRRNDYNLEKCNPHTKRNILYIGYTI